MGWEGGTQEVRTEAEARNERRPKIATISRRHQQSSSLILTLFAIRFAHRFTSAVCSTIPPSSGPPGSKA